MPNRLLIVTALVVQIAILLGPSKVASQEQISVYLDQELTRCYIGHDFVYNVRYIY